MPKRAFQGANEAEADSTVGALRTAFVMATLDEVQCGLPVSAVQEITRAVAITPLPSAPRGVEGIVDYHGEVIPVIDLRDRLGMAPRQARASDYFIVASTGGRLAGLRVDQATTLVELAASDIIAAERVVAATRPVAGIARTSAGLILLQDLAAMLSQSEEERLRAAMARAASPAANA